MSATVKQAEAPATQTPPTPPPVASTPAASTSLALVVFKQPFGMVSPTAGASAQATVTVATLQDQQRAIELELVDGHLREVALGVLDKQTQGAMKQLAELAALQKLAPMGGFFALDKAAKDFSTVDPKTLAGLVGAANAAVSRLPAQAQGWLLSLGPTTRNQLLHQMINDGNTGALERICAGLRVEPPATWPSPADEKGCMGLLRYAARDRREDMGLTADRKLQSRMAALCKRIDDGRAFLEGVRKQAAASGKSARERMAEISKHIETFLKVMYSEAAAEYGLSDYSLLAVGSLARGEVFPYSDLDYSLVAIEAAEWKLDEIEAYLNWQLKAMQEPALDSIGKGTPEDVAERHMATDMDVLLDARVILSVGEKGPEAADEYIEAISKYVKDEPKRKAALLQLIAGEKEKYSPTGEYLNKPAKDVKNGLLRLPTFTIRNLVAFYGLAGVAPDLTKRCEALLQDHLVGPKFVQDVLRVVDFAAKLRLKLHAHYKSETEEFYLPGGAPPAPPAYVLTAAEAGEYAAAVAINTDIYRRLTLLTNDLYLTATELLNGATLAVTKTEGDFRTSTVTNMGALPGKTATLLEWSLDGEVKSRFFTIDGVQYTAENGVGVIRATRGRTNLVKQGSANPFL